MELAASWKLFLQCSAFVRAIYPRPRKQFNGLSKQLREAVTFKARFSFVFGAGYLPVRVIC